MKKFGKGVITMKYRMKKLLAFVMSLLMVMQMIPTTAFAGLPLDVQVKGYRNNPETAVEITLPDEFTVSENHDTGYYYFVVAGTETAGYDSYS